MSKFDAAALRERTIPLDTGRAQAIESVVLSRHARYVARVRVARVVAVSVAVLSAVLVVASVAFRRPAMVATQAAPPVVASRAPVDAPAPAAGEFGGVVMTDGSRVTFLTSGTQLAQSGTDGRQSTLVSGAARFDVVHDAQKPFRVTAGSVVVEDVGTVFALRLLDGGRTLVSVESGAVSVRGPDGERRLEASASEVFPMPAARSAEPTARAAPLPPPSWRKLARDGDYGGAYAIIQDAGSPVRDDPEELLLAADSARLTGHVDRAVPLLRRLTAKFPQDTRAGLAAFTLGRILLDDLGKPREAAEAFAVAYARGGPLAEDALSREVEAYARAGDRSAAKTRADRYLVAYPSGRHVSLVRRLTEGP